MYRKHIIAVFGLVFLLGLFFQYNRTDGFVRLSANTNPQALAQYPLQLSMTAEEQPPVLRPRTDWTKEEQLLKKLEQELAPELDALGFFKTEQLYQRSRAGASPQRPAIDKRLKIAGTVRYHYVTNSGDRRVNFDDSRLRARVYYDYNIDNNWHGSRPDNCAQTSGQSAPGYWQRLPGAAVPGGECIL